MSDLSQAIIAKSDQLNADDLIAGPITITVTKVAVKPGEQPVSISYEGDNGKPWKPSKSMCRILALVWGKDGNAYVGRRLTLYRDPFVKWGGIAVGGIRISHMSDIKADETHALTVTRGNKKPYTVKPITIKRAVPAIDEDGKVRINRRGETVMEDVVVQPLPSDKQNPAAKPVGAAASPASNGGAGGAGAESPAQVSDRAGSYPEPGDAAAPASEAAGVHPPAAPAADFVYRLVTSKGETRETTDGAVWADTICKMIGADPQGIWTRNQEHIKAAFASPDRSHAERVEQAWKDAP